MLYRFVLLTFLSLSLSAPVSAAPASSEAPAHAASAAPAKTGTTPAGKAAPSAHGQKPHAAAKPKAKPHNKAPAKTHPKAAAKAQSDAQSKAELHKPLPHVNLDLRLPKEMLHGLTPGDSVAPPTAAEKRLLPPLFVEKPKEETPFQIGGRLIQRERGERVDPNDDSWHSDIRGAELQFQFRN